MQMKEKLLQDLYIHGILTARYEFKVWNTYPQQNFNSVANQDYKGLK